MAISIDRAGKNLAQNIKSFREKRNLTQAELARQAGVTRASVTLMESGSSNPTLDILIKLSRALQTSLEELISFPYLECRHIKAKEVSQKSEKGFLLRKLLPDKIYGAEIDEICLEPDAVMTGTPHVEGAKEYFTCIDGQITIYVLGRAFHLRNGDVLAFPGDKAHSYKNEGNKKSRGISVVFLTFSGLISSAKKS